MFTRPAKYWHIETLPASLGYEPYDARLRCLGQSLATALTSAGSQREVVCGLLHLCPPSLSCCVRFTNRFTEPVFDLWLSTLPRVRTCVLRPMGSPVIVDHPRGADHSRRFYSPSLLTEDQASDQHIRPSRHDRGPRPSAMRPWASGFCADDPDVARSWDDATVRDYASVANAIMTAGASPRWTIPTI